MIILLFFKIILPSDPNTTIRTVVIVFYFDMNSLVQGQICNSTDISLLQLISMFGTQVTKHSAQLLIFQVSLVLDGNAQNVNWLNLQRIILYSGHAHTLTPQ